MRGLALHPLNRQQTHRSPIFETVMGLRAEEGSVSGGSTAAIDRLNRVVRDNTGAIDRLAGAIADNTRAIGAITGALNSTDHFPINMRDLDRLNNQ